MRIKQIAKITGTISCITGLCIGGTSNALEIGGISQEVIKNPITKEPYIPGSSLKGKMRSELEKKYGNISKDKFGEYSQPCGCGKEDCLICKIFGAHKKPGAASAPTRIIVRDAILTEESKKIIAELPIDHGSYLERKVENIVKRNTGTADTPRTIERVPAGLSFDFEIVLRIFEGDDEKELIDYVLEGMKLVELSYLGGSGSRGYGQVKFKYEIKYEM